MCISWERERKGRQFALTPRGKGSYLERPILLLGRLPPRPDKVTRDKKEAPELERGLG